MNPDEFQQQFENLFRTNVTTVKKTVRRTLLTLLVVNCGCLFATVGGITLVILGCLRLFGVI